MKFVSRLLPGILGSACLASTAMAVTPLQTTVTANPAALATAAQIATATGASATATTTGSISGGSVEVARFNTATGILVGARVAVNTAVSATAQVTGTVRASGNGRTVDANTSLAGSVSTAGVTFTAPTLVADRSCSGGNCPNSPSNQSTTTTGAIVGTLAVPLANLSAYAGAGTVGFTRSATGSTRATNGSGALTGTANGLYTFGSATPASNVYSITYDYLNFANPSFNGAATVTDLTLDFGALIQNSGLVTLNFSLFNIGNINSAGLSLTSISRSTGNLDFTTSLVAFTNGLDGGNSATYSMTFNPVALGLADDVFTFMLTDYAPGGIGNKTYTLTAHTTADVTMDLGPIPEPGSWLLMILGFGAVGVAARRRTGQLAL